MSDCALCPVEPECHYPYKPCECVHQRKFWSERRHAEWLEQQTAKVIDEAAARISSSIAEVWRE